MLKLVIITEGGSRVGFGHVARCLSLCEAFEDSGIEPLFLINGEPGIKNTLKGKNLRIFNWLEDKNRMLGLIKGFDIGIIDSYLAGLSSYNLFSRSVRMPLYIDDNNRLNYPRGVVVNTNLYAPNLPYRRARDVQYLLGRRYTTLRRPFWNVASRKIRVRPKSLLITSGGSDIRNMVPGLLENSIKKFPDLIKKVIIGPGFKNINEIRKLKDAKTEIVYSPDASAMKKVMLDSDMAISGGGVTLYELARTGVGTVGICFAENQRDNLLTCQKKGFLEFAGDFDAKGTMENITQAIGRLLPFEERLRRYGLSRQLVDGQGCHRIRDFMLQQLSHSCKNKR